MDTYRLARAVSFATVAHDGAYRKGTDIPYIAHPIETALIVMTMTDDEDLIIAAILHDVVEDTEYTLEDIEKEFGKRIAELVKMESENKMPDIPKEKSWKRRKTAALKVLENLPKEAKLICLADKLSNMRLSAQKYETQGDDMWLVFNQKDKKEQEWYYRGVAQRLKEYEDTDAYKEYLRLCNIVFK